MRPLHQCLKWPEQNRFAPQLASYVWRNASRVEWETPVSIAEGPRCELRLPVMGVDSEPSATQRMSGDGAAPQPFRRWCGADPDAPCERGLDAVGQRVDGGSSRRPIAQLPVRAPPLLGARVAAAFTGLRVRHGSPVWGSTRLGLRARGFAPGGSGAQDLARLAGGSARPTGTLAGSMAANTALPGTNLSELAGHAGVRECLQFFTREKQWINEVHLQACRIPAPTFLEQERAAWFLEQFRGYGCDASIDRAGNVVAALGPPNCSRNQ